MSGPKRLLAGSSRSRTRLDCLSSTSCRTVGRGLLELWRACSQSRRRRRSNTFTCSQPRVWSGRKPGRTALACSLSQSNARGYYSRLRQRWQSYPATSAMGSSSQDRLEFQRFQVCVLLNILHTTDHQSVDERNCGQGNITRIGREDRFGRGEEGRSFPDWPWRENIETCVLACLGAIRKARLARASTNQENPRAP